MSDVIILLFASVDSFIASVRVDSIDWFRCGKERALTKHALDHVTFHFSVWGRIII